MAEMVRVACHVCGKHPGMGVSVFRQNAKGQPGVWACEEHDKRQDAITHDTVAKIEARDPGRSKH